MDLRIEMDICSAADELCWSVEVHGDHALNVKSDVIVVAGG